MGVLVDQSVSCWSVGGLRSMRRETPTRSQAVPNLRWNSELSLELEHQATTGDLLVQALEPVGRTPRVRRTAQDHYGDLITGQVVDVPLR